MESQQGRSLREVNGGGALNGADQDEPGVARVVEQSRRVRQDLEGLVSAVAEARSGLEERLRERLTERPYLGLATAAGVGYVLGAGASPLLFRAAFGIGSRVALAMVMRRLASAVGEVATGHS
jgi:hypothetical protein